MKRVIAFATLFCALFAAGATAAERHSALPSDTMIWAGLDYSMTRMIGPGAFNDPDAIFPRMLENWNTLFLRERIRIVEKVTGRRVLVDVGGVGKANAGASTTQILTTTGPADTIEQTHITPEMIARAVKSYEMENKSGLGVVFIVDRFVKVGSKANGAVYVVVFDVAKREVISSRREVARAAGAGFRNYWFRPIKDAEKALKKLE